MPDITDSAKQPGQRPSHRVRWGVAGAIGLAGALGVTAFMVLPGVSATPSDKVTICHATSSTGNPYTVATINTSSVNEVGKKYLNGHGDHTGPVFGPGITSGWGDIIPPFTDGPSGASFPGYNWDAAGQAIWKAGCTYASPSPSPTETSASPTPTPTETSASPTPTPTETSASPTPTETSPSPTPITTSPAPITTSPAPTFPPIFPTPTPTETSATPTPTTTSPAPITTSPAPITTSPAPITTSPAPITTSPAPSVSPTPITTPSVDGTPTPPAPIVTGGTGPTGGLPQSVPAGGGPGDAPDKPAWMWFLAAAFLALLVASMRHVMPGRDDE